MANQSPDRREALQLLAKAAAAAQFPGFVRWVYGAGGQDDAPAQSGAHSHSSISGPRTPYRPQFFAPAEYETIDSLSELIIPADESPGAHAAGVAEFIDFMAYTDREIQTPFRSGLSWLDEHARTHHGSPFARLAEGDQIALLQTLSSTNGSGSPAEGKRFFDLVRRYTVMGYYTSRVGLEQLDYPGLKLYASSPACPHADDPEHRHLLPVAAPSAHA